MPCKICGDICYCLSDLRSAGDAIDSSKQGVADLERMQPSARVEMCAATIENSMQRGQNDFAESSAQAESDLRRESDSEPPPKDTAWREEVAARLNRYQSRRKPRPPRYPSLCLPLENPRPLREESHRCEIFVQPSHHALAVRSVVEEDHERDRIAERPSEHRDSANSLQSSPVQSTASAAVPKQAAVFPTPVAAARIVPTAKIIEFPRPWIPPAPPADQLAEPVVVHPRIIDVPEVVPPLPALGGITIEAPEQPEIERRPGIDFPLQGPSLSRRLSAAAIDALITLAACLIFETVFWKLTTQPPPRLQMAEIAAVFAVLFWAGYQYLLLVYAGTTPGLRLVRLTLSRFDGTPASRRLRRWRVLASFLSAVSVGMGYIWMFLDEDALCWHDRITHTYLAPRAFKVPTA